VTKLDRVLYTAARLNVSVSGMDRDLAQKLMDAAHLVCPYSCATRGNIDVVLKMKTDRRATPSPIGAAPAAAE
jgi:organic hydroperoxide reductase OsmC/OhrA